MEAEKVVGIVRKVGVHFENIVEALGEGPFETCQVGRAEAKLAAALYHVQALGELLLQGAHYCGRAVGGAVLYDEYMVLPFKGEDFPDDGFDVLLFVVGGYDYDFPAHFLSSECVLQR